MQWRPTEPARQPVYQTPTTAASPVLDALHVSTATVRSAALGVAVFCLLAVAAATLLNMRQGWTHADQHYRTAFLWSLGACAVLGVLFVLHT